MILTDRWVVWTMQSPTPPPPPPPPLCHDKFAYNFEHQNLDAYMYAKNLWQKLAVQKQLKQAICKKLLLHIPCLTYMYCVDKTLQFSTEAGLLHGQDTFLCPLPPKKN